ncbi:MAG: hypothetical protein QOJ65_1814 [Fimbriimonadaceae bacterium]|nr:hypothetical protein [Fimbriimonadaceae bacterium]
MQGFSSFSERELAQVFAVQGEDVEDVQLDGVVAIGVGDERGLGEAVSLEHPVERWAALVIERDDLAIEDGFTELCGLQRFDQRGEFVADVDVVAGEEPRFAVVYLRDDSDAVELDLEGPIGVGEGLLSFPREHGAGYGHHHA